MNGKEIPTFSLEQAFQSAAETKQSLSSLERDRMLQGKLPLRYLRNHPSITLQEQVALLDAHVGIVGCGGLGLYVLEQLARLGVGHITVWDPDVFDEPNLNRQVLARIDTLRKSKVACAGEHVARINPAVCFEGIYARWEESDPALLKRQDVMVNALDHIISRRELALCCSELGIPLVDGAVGGWYGQLSVLYPGESSRHLLYPPGSNEGGLEKEEGTLAFAAALVASLQAAEVSKILLNRGEGLRGRICMINLLDLEFEIFEL